MLLLCMRSMLFAFNLSIIGIDFEVKTTQRDLLRLFCYKKIINRKKIKLKAKISCEKLAHLLASRNCYNLITSCCMHAEKYGNSLHIHLIFHFILFFCCCVNGHSMHHRNVHNSINLYLLRSLKSTREKSLQFLPHQMCREAHTFVYFFAHGIIAMHPILIRAFLNEI